MMPRTKIRTSTGVRPFAVVRFLVPAAALLPAAWIGWDAFHDGLGANPIEEITHRTGDWALRLLLLSLAVTPVRRWSGWNKVIRLRRTLGLLAFFYAVLHLTTFVCLDHFFDWQAIVEDVKKRKYITMGMTAFALLVPLAVTSTRGWIRRLGKRWTQLHRLVYPAALAATIHFLWLAKGNRSEPKIYASVLLVLLLARIVRKPRLSPRGSPPTTGTTNPRRPESAAWDASSR